MDVISFFMIFNDFDFMFLLMNSYFESIQLFFSLKKMIRDDGSLQHQFFVYHYIICVN